MKVFDERKKNSVRFEDVEFGKVFFFENTEDYGVNPYISIEDIQRIDGVTFSAVDLVDGVAVNVKNYEKVIPCEAILTVK